MPRVGVVQLPGCGMRPERVKYCPADPCPVIISVHKAFCRKHWRQLSEPTRLAVYRAARTANELLSRVAIAKAVEELAGGASIVATKEVSVDG